MRLALCCLIAFVVAFETLVYTLWLYERRAHGPMAQQQRRPLRYAIGPWLIEAVSLGLALLTWPLGLLCRGRPRALGSGGGRPVVLLHGWAMTPASLGLLALRLRRAGRRPYLLGYPSTGADMNRKAATIARQIASIREESGADQVDIVAHSLGGLLARAAMRDCGGLDFIGRLVTLGTPHQGTVLAAFLSWPRIKPMRPGSRFLQGLAENDPLPSRLAITAVFSGFDALVFPQRLAEYPGAMNVEVDDVGHMSLLVSRRVYRVVEESLDRVGR